MYSSPIFSLIRPPERLAVSKPPTSPSPSSSCSVSLHRPCSHSTHLSPSSQSSACRFTCSPGIPPLASSPLSLPATTEIPLAPIAQPRPFFLADAEEIEFMEDLVQDYGLGKAMVAGAVAGVMEHLWMFPVDTIKTRMQTQYIPGQKLYKSVPKAIVQIAKEEGIFRLYRGASAIVAGAIPSHAIYFATYEQIKAKLNSSLPMQGKGQVNVTNTGIAGACATVMHDLVVTPLDVIKQRLQMYNSKYSGFSHCARTIFLQEGPKAFFISYPTTVAMNVPFMAVHFIAYETAKLALSDSSGEHGFAQELVAGGFAGALGGLMSSPLDVLKTRLQTQHVATISSFATTAASAASGTSSCCAIPSSAPSQTTSFSASAVSSTLKPTVPIACPIVKGDNSLNTASVSASLGSDAERGTPRDRLELKRLLRGAQKSVFVHAAEVAQQEGFKGFFKGATARVLYFTPSAAIVWTTYETMKRLLDKVKEQGGGVMMYW